MCDTFPVAVTSVLIALVPFRGDDTAQTANADPSDEIAAAMREKDELTKQLTDLQSENASLDAKYNYLLFKDPIRTYDRQLTR